LAHAASEEVTKRRVESRSGAEYKLGEDVVQSRRLSWVQASKGSNKLLRPEGLRETVTLVLESSIRYHQVTCWCRLINNGSTSYIKNANTFLIKFDSCLLFLLTNLWGLH